MDYPKLILPQAEFKLIVADLTGYFLLRMTRTNDKNELIDQVTGKPNLKHVCSPSDHIIDFSCSLLGIYTPDHIVIEFTEQGKQKYMHSCSPDATVVIPIFETDFITIDGRHFWCVPIEQLHKAEFTYQSGNKPEEIHKVTCLVRHTPMLWNFWHFSLHWETAEGIVTKREDAGAKKIIQKVAHSARVLLSETLSFELPEPNNVIPEHFYKKPEELANQAAN